jgi:DNA-binding beta-propeller fold protein YncE
MQSRVTFLSATIAAVFLAGCSSQQLQTGNSALPLGIMRAPQPGPTPVPIQLTPWQQSLFVNDENLNSVKLFTNATWVANGSFNNGVSHPWGNWSDQKYLYVANNTSNAGNVAEYRPNYSTPIFTYTNGLTQVADVSTQVLSNVHYVFVTGFSAGFVKEFKRDTNTVIATCYPGGTQVFGVAVAPNGSVFVAYDDNMGLGHIVEYVGGLGGCNGTLLPITFGYVLGMVLDNAGRLVICQDNPPAVDVIDPPYSSISGTLGSGYSSPEDLSINANNALAFVSDGHVQIRVLQYPSGTLIHTLGSADGLSAPGGAVEWTNYGF